MSIGFSEKDLLLFDKLNRRSWTHTFSPVHDVDWESSTTREEYRQLYDAWSLLLGSRHEETLDDEQRIRFAQYQQMNLMLGTSIFERCALANIESLYGDDDEPAYHEYITHLIKEESYHFILFSRAIARIRESDTELQPLPDWPFRAYFSTVLFILRYLPSRRLRHGTFFYLLHFVEEVTLQANIMTKRTLDRDESLVLRTWELHAIDESRHVAFDDIMMRNAKLPGALNKVPSWLAIPLCVGASLLLNINEIWAARKLGVRVGYHELPKLMKRTTAPFKLKVFSTLFNDEHKTESPET